MKEFYLDSLRCSDKGGDGTSRRRHIVSAYLYDATAADIALAAGIEVMTIANELRGYFTRLSASIGRFEAITNDYRLNGRHAGQFKEKWLKRLQYLETYEKQIAQQMAVLQYNRSKICWDELKPISGHRINRAQILSKLFIKDSAFADILENQNFPPALMASGRPKWFAEFVDMWQRGSSIPTTLMDEKKNGKVQKVKSAASQSASC